MKQGESDDNQGRTETFGAMLRSRRVKAGLTQKALADTVGGCGPLISQYEGGHRLPSIRMFAKLCAALGLSNDEVVFLIEVIEQTSWD